jgi:long-chain acyl-CoA synthetase
MQNVDDLFRRRVQRQPDHPVVLGPAESRVTYADLDAMIAAAAESLKSAGVGPGACVGIHVPSGLDAIVSTYAVWRRGACAVPIPIDLSDVEKLEICRTIAIDFLMAGTSLPDFVHGERDGIERELPGIARVLPLARRRQHPSGFSEINAAFIRFTSGTTGTSKGIVLSHESISDRINAANDALKIGPDDRVLWVLSMSYHFTVSIVAYLTFGATIVLPRNHLGEGLVDSINRHAATVVYASPMHYAWMADSPSSPPLHSLRLVVSTATSLTPEIAAKFRQRFELPIAQALGIIEVGLPAINFDFAAERPETVGRILPAYRVRLSDVGLGKGVGEILLAGKGFLDAYYEPWRTRDEILDDGWFHTGDIGELDAEGCLIIRGRSKDIINTAGMKFFPREVEHVIESHASVVEACVFSRPCSKLGEVSSARVVLKPGANLRADELLELCRSRLADYKVPQEIEFVDHLERTASGKLLHRSQPTRPALAVS